ncbi:enoyl-CoA hydratase/isomerase family protein [Ferdinandcohnia quinoae]|uniref:Ethylmalonyl-CoA decarboxylase n=1 Tax=Fredinandcohnia quinoae TaxID=2918902 RepID=A0AAW5DV31_9BACI|nr:enoyl-CoA hydratase/isomerase family protein [Fredinandcohnia sp. SECRCQ15]MCH1623893.1 enoyl-CoA hydratase/isomerase family protein [Fredinandcohnia sp. SECRCQ15]
MEKFLVSRDKNGLVWFTINRPEKRNAIDYDVMDGLAKIINYVEENDSDKILIITGAGNKAFCSGGDLNAFHSLLTQEDAYKMLSKMGGILYKLLTLSKPTVALLNGVAIGGGCELATACDYRLGSTDGSVGFVQGRMGITTGWGGATMLLEKMPYENALQMLMSAEVFSAIDGYKKGFIHKVIGPDNLLGECEQFISKQIIHNINVLTAYKNVAIRKWQESNIKARMFEEIETCSHLWATKEHHTAVKEFLETKI